MIEERICANEMNTVGLCAWSHAPHGRKTGQPYGRTEPRQNIYQLTGEQRMAVG